MLCTDSGRWVFVEETLPHAKFFRHWRVRFFKQVAAESGRGEAGLHWIGEIETVKSIDELVETDPNWINFSAKLASGFMKILSGDFLRQITLLEEKLMTKKLTLNGRQLGFLIWDKYRRDEAEVGLTEFFDLREVRLVNDDLRRYVSDWDEVMFGLFNDQDPKYLLSLFDEQVKKCTHFKQVYNLYKVECTHRGLEHTYDNLRKWVQAHIDARQQERMKSQLQQQSNTRSAAAGLGGGLPLGKPPPSGKGPCWQFLENKGRCSRGEACPFKHDYERLKTYVSSKGKGKGKSRSPSKGRSKGEKGKGRTRSPSKGRGKGNSPRTNADSSGRQRSPHPRSARSPSNGNRGQLQDGRYTPSKTRANSRGKSPSGEKDKPPCAAFLQGTCSKGSACKEWHVADCMFYKDGRCTAGNKCVWLHRDKNGKIQSRVFSQYC